jgi:hypothetical protein
MVLDGPRVGRESVRPCPGDEMYFAGSDPSLAGSHKQTMRGRHHMAVADEILPF